MGLDMYLTGTKYFPLYDEKHPRPTEDGFEVEEHKLALGYWRKHPNLHGFIVQKFADGKDDCQPIPLDAVALRDIVGAVKDKALPETTGFFFGKSAGSDEEMAEDVAILEKALAWLETEDPAEAWRHVEYCASW